MRHALQFPVTVAIGVVIVSACNAETAPRGPEEICVRACAARASSCTSHQCARGCNFVLDRLAEREGDYVIACVARASAPCDDHTCARCATGVGPDADGGP